MSRAALKKKTHPPIRNVPLIFVTETKKTDEIKKRTRAEWLNYISELIVKEKEDECYSYVLKKIKASISGGYHLCVILNKTIRGTQLLNAGTQILEKLKKHGFKLIEMDLLTKDKSGEYLFSIWTCI